MTSEEILEQLDQLTSTYSTLSQTRNRLVLDGKKEEAERLESSAETLRQTIDELRGRAADQWTGEAGQLETEVRNLNQAIEGMIAEIQDDIQTAQTIIDLAGAIDEMVATVRDLAGLRYEPRASAHDQPVEITTSSTSQPR
jgi:hypothetical protein